MLLFMGLVVSLFACEERKRLSASGVLKGFGFM